MKDLLRESRPPVALSARIHARLYLMHLARMMDAFRVSIRDVFPFYSFFEEGCFIEMTNCLALLHEEKFSDRFHGVLNPYSPLVVCYRSGGSFRVELGESVVVDEQGKYAIGFLNESVMVKVPRDLVVQNAWRF